jgi:hypothetical protein
VETVFRPLPVRLVNPRDAADNRGGLPADTPSFRPMARWPRHEWTTLFTYLAVFLGFPLLCWLAYAWVRGRW